MSATGHALSFTIRTRTQGFTDQLMQFSAFYKLGLALGYRYVFTPLVSMRSQPRGAAPAGDRDDIYEFLGFRQHFDSDADREEVASARELEVELSDRIVADNGIHSFDDLKAYVASCVEREAGQGDHPDSRILVVLRLDKIPPPVGMGKRQFFGLIHAAVPRFQDGLCLRSLYFQARQSEPQVDRFAENSLKILMHIRQGDTALIRTPWDSFIPVDSRRPDFMTEQPSYEAAANTYSNNALDAVFEPAEYQEFLRSLLSACASLSCSTLCFSDGYQRAFDILEHQAERLALSAEQWRALRESRQSYDQRQFATFDSVPGCESVIGETQDSLHDLVHAALTADIIVVAAQQRMLPKLVASYCDRESPIVVVLYRNRIPDNSDIIAGHEERFIYVNIDRPDLDGLTRAISQLGASGAH